MMGLQKSLSLSIIVGVALTACGPQALRNQQTQGQVETKLIAPLQDTVAPLQEELKAEGIQNIQVLDVGRGKASNASFALKIKLADSNFGTKASVGGGVVKTAADINDFEVFLYQFNAPVSPVGLPGPAADLSAITPVFSSIVAKAGGFAGTQAFIFNNVPPNIATNKYYVGIRARDSNPLNITDYTGWENSASSPIALSTGGGDGSGGVTVNSDNSIPAPETAALTMTLNLLSETGAKIDSNVTVTNGNPTLPSITVN